MCLQAQFTPTPDSHSPLTPRLLGPIPIYTWSCTPGECVCRPNLHLHLTPVLFFHLDSQWPEGVHRLLLVRTLRIQLLVKSHWLVVSICMHIDRNRTNLCCFTTAASVVWASDTRFQMLGDFKLMADGSTFYPIPGVEVRVEVGSNRSLDLSISECGECKTVFGNSGILDCVRGVSWGDIENVDLKSIVSSVNVEMATCNITQQCLSRTSVSTSWQQVFVGPRMMDTRMDRQRASCMTCCP